MAPRECWSLITMLSRLLLLLMQRVKDQGKGVQRVIISCWSGRKGFKRQFEFSVGNMGDGVPREVSVTFAIRAGSIIIDVIRKEAMVDGTRYNNCRWAKIIRYSKPVMVFIVILAPVEIWFRWMGQERDHGIGAIIIVNDSSVQT